MPKVSVLIATHNRAQFVSHAIESALSQSLKDIEVLVVDDGSTDGTKEVVEKLRARDKRVKYLECPPSRRIAVVSNFGIRHAAGEYIAILDDDDWWINPQKLDMQVAFLDANQRVVGCGGGYVVVDEDGREKEKFLKPERDQEIKQNALVANPMVNSTTLFRRSAAAKVGFYDESLKQFADWDFWLKLGKLGELYNFQRYFVKYRMWRGGASFRKQREAAVAGFRIVLRHRHAYRKFFFALGSAIAYFAHAYLPNFIKQFTSPLFSRLKKLLFAKKIHHRQNFEN